MVFQEDLLHFVWKFKRFKPLSLKTACGMSLEIVSVGTHNTNAGPDFKDALLRIDGTLWAGNVEVHIRSSDWIKHKHNIDAAYDNVILHVVFEDDISISRNNGAPIPTFVLKDLLDETLYARYHELSFCRQNFIACENHINRVDIFHVQNWLDRLLIERLEKRSETILNNLKKNKGDWEETFYQMLARNFGFQVNALPFEMLATSLPQRILSWHKKKAEQVEALVFGQAGFLEDDFTDFYPSTLKKEYTFLKKKYDLKPIQKHLWKFFRLRPVNFPTIRLAQFASLIVQSEHLFSKVIQCQETEQLKHLFLPVKMNTYWNEHFQFDKPSVQSTKKLGDEAVHNIFLNTIVPFLFTYGKFNGLQKYINRSIQMLENLPSENNNIIKGFIALGHKPVSAHDSQGLIELKQNYCNHKLCLHCAIGCQLLKPA